MQPAENKDYSRDVILRLSPTRNTIIVEEQKPGGIAAYREIDPLELYYVINQSYASNDYLDSGFLPGHCLHLSMSATEKCFVLWNPELRSDVIYGDREYPNFPIPRMVFGVRVLENGKVAECSMGVVADEAPTMDTPMFFYPFSNVHSDDRVCTGNNVLPRYRKISALKNFPRYLLGLPDNDDMYDREHNRLSIFNPLYFIEELGEDGKKLLERYLPTIPHETVLSQLSEPVREHLKNETILSPEGSLKRCREEIRGLEERITYLRGQKDLAASQGESHEQAEQELTLQVDTLREEIAELEQRQFSGMDVSDMQERLVELSGRYEEAARDERTDTSKLREQIQTLREKIARREGEQYQSKFTEALAEASARVKDLGVRYQRESAAYKAFHAGMECPACHRSVTEQSLPEVQAALKKVLSELYAAGSEQRAQLIELQEMDKKAADTFAQFKEDDLGKWAAEAAEMEQRCASLAEQASAETERLRAEIQTLTADLEYGNLSQSEYDHLGTCREELRQSEAKIAALQTMTAAQLPDFDREIAQANAGIAEIKRKMANVIAYISKRAELTFSQLKMNRVEISLYDVVKSTGEVKDTFKFQYGGRRYDRLSLSEKIRAGMEVSELMKRLTGRNYPVFVDNMESVDDLANVRPTGQIIMAKCVSGAALQVKPIRPIAFAEQRAA